MASDWKPGRLRDIADVVMGQSPTADYVNEACQGKPLLNGPTEFGAMHPTPVQFTTDVRKKANPGDLLFCVRGSTTGRMNWADQEYAIGRGLAAIRHRDGDAFQHFVRAVIELKLPELLAAATGSTFPNVGRDQLLDIPASIPPKGEQQVISSFFKGIDDKIEINRRINQTLEAMAQAIFKSWFVDFDPVKAKIAARAEGRDPLRAAMTAISGKLDTELDALPPEQYEQLVATVALFPDEMEDSELGEIPRGWSVGTLSDFASFQNGYAFKTKDWTDSGHPVVKIGNVKPGIIYLSGCSFVAHETVNGLDRFALKRGDLLVGMTGYVGETGLVPALDSVAYLNQRVGRISTVNGVSDIGYPFCLVRDPAYKAYAESKAHGSAQANVSGKDLMDYKAVVSDTRVLKIFNAYVAKIINALLSHYEEKQSLAVLRDTLLPKLLSGELSVTDVTREVST
jgi:type I restriction enzyme, S subunit